MSKEKLNQIRKLMEDYPTTVKAYIKAKKYNKGNDPPMGVAKVYFVDMVSEFREKLEAVLR